MVYIFCTNEQYRPSICFTITPFSQISEGLRLQPYASINMKRPMKINLKRIELITQIPTHGTQSLPFHHFSFCINELYSKPFALN